MPKYQNKCPKHIELDIYQGCSFNCIYCISNGQHDQPAFQLQKEIAKIADNQNNNQPYYLSPWTDAYQHEEENTKHTQQIIATLASKGRPFFVITKSLLVLRDIEYFRNKENAFVAISLNCLNDAISVKFEPGAPKANERVQLIENLAKEKGIKTVVKIDPIIPGLTDGKELEQLVDWLAKIKPYAVTAETLRLSEPIVENMQKTLSNNLIDSILSHYDEVNLEPKHPQQKYRLAVLENIATKLKRAGVRASFCQASLPYRISEFDCRGGYNYDF